MYPPPQDPGFLIRRLHQIHAALFELECAGFGITPVQHSILSVIARHLGLDQAQIRELTGLERIKLIKIILGLQSAGYLKPVASQLDRRQKILTLTPAGERILALTAESVARANAQFLVPLSPEQRVLYLELTETLVKAASVAFHLK